MKVPKIAVGVDVLIDGREFHIVYVDFLNELFSAHRWIPGSPTGNWGHWENTTALPFEEYKPVPNLENFMKAITEWDYHYRASDDPGKSEGKEQEQALIALLKALPKEDQHILQKIVEIVVISNA